MRIIRQTRLCIAAALLLSVAFSISSSALATQDIFVLPQAGYWGEPPEIENITDDVEFPAYKGWYRHISRTETYHGSAIDNSFVALASRDLIRLFAVNSGDLLWKVPVSPIIPGMGDDATWLVQRITLAPDLLYYECQQGLVARHTADGSLAWWSADVGMAHMLLPEARLIETEQEKQYCELLDCTSVKLSNIHLLTETKLLAEYDYILPGFYSTELDLHCFELQDGELIPGEMQIISLAEDYSGLAAEFVASPAPLDDIELMQRIVAGGAKCWNRLLQVLPTRSAAHRDTLAAILLYRDHWRVDPDSAYNRLITPYYHRKLFNELLAVPGEESLPAMLRWIESGQFDNYECLLMLAIARSGDDGVNWLAANDRLGYSGERKADGTPPETQVYQSSYLYTDYDSDKYIKRKEATDSSGGTVTAFTSAGLASLYDIYISLDPQPAGGFGHVLPTGLVDHPEYWSHKEIPAPGQLSLDIMDDTLQIGHTWISPGTQPDGEWHWSHDKQYQLSSINMEDLLRDTDGDGLTDIAEGMLHLDPANPDSDGDGSIDSLDCTPNVDAATMGAVERGIARALELHLMKNLELDYGDWTPQPRVGNPWQSRCFQLYGSGSVAFAANAHEYSICLSAQQVRDMELQHPLQPGCWPDLRAEWIDLRRDPAEQFPHSSIYELIMESDQSYSEDELATRMESWWESAMGFPDDYKGPQPDAVLDISSNMHGEKILFILINGEYWPVAIYNTWVASAGIPTTLTPA